MTEGMPGRKKEKSRTAKGALFALGAALAAYGANELAPKEGAKQEYTREDPSVPKNSGETQETSREKMQEHEPAEALAAFKKMKEEGAVDGVVSYNEVDHSIQNELRENVLQDYLRFHPKVFESIRNTFGGAPIRVGESNTVYVIATASVLDTFSAYTGVKGDVHLFDLTLTEEGGELQVKLRNPAVELGLPQGE